MYYISIWIFCMTSICQSSIFTVFSFSVLKTINSIYARFYITREKIICFLGSKINA
nr:MAG TPA: hypothetical protein [Caudoviricetes sp.]